MAVNKFTLKLLQANKLTGSVYEFIFTANALEFKAGQFISLHIIDAHGKEQRRNYSISNTPQASNTLSIAVSYVPNGLASTLLWNLKPGDEIIASGPYGIFVLEPTPPQRYILIGTGTGIAPYRSMLTQIEILLTNPVQQVVIVEGVRTKQDLLYTEEFCQLDNKLANFNFLACYSQENGNLAAYERLGYIQKHLTELKLNPANDLVYLCGNPQMVDELFHLLQEIGFDKRAIKREKYVISR
jgi:ferredoxin-NADP reductase